MICDTCKKEMNYFIEGQSCGWKCSSCGNSIVTTYIDEIELDETIYSISISPIATPTAVEIKHVAKIRNCSFIDAREILISGGNLGNFDARKSREILQIFNDLGIHYLSAPEFMHNL